MEKTYGNPGKVSRLDEGLSNRYSLIRRPRKSAKLLRGVFRVV